MSALTITKENFELEVTMSDKPVLLDFWAPWCEPCKMVAPIIDEIADEVFILKVGKINVDEQPELAAEFKIMSIPTLAVLKGGVIVKKSVGVKSKADILDMLSE
ncbi:thioredoxin [Acetobacterium sp.]|uniref:thioredoxin n=1 Tax=Acetobacterium sp. TaxID=1872094 RepID=UPI002F42F762